MWHLWRLQVVLTAAAEGACCGGDLQAVPGPCPPPQGKGSMCGMKAARSWFNWQSFTLCIKIIRRTSKTSMMWAGHLSLESTFTSHSASCHGAPWEAAGGLSWLGPCPRCGRQRQACAHWSPALAGGPCGTESADARSFCLFVSLPLYNSGFPSHI